MISDLSTRKEQLLDHARSDSFFTGTALANEIPFYIFDYDPKDELGSRVLANELGKELENRGHKVLHINVYETVLDLLLKKFGPEDYMRIEKEEGFLYLAKEVIKPKIEGKLLTDKINELSQGYELIYLTHLGTARPFVRAHSLLNNLSGILPTNIVMVLFYPGSYNKKGGGMSLNLFDKFVDDNHYYRAFPLCH